MNIRPHSKVNRTTNEETTDRPRVSNTPGSPVFADPVSYLASFGIDSELVEVLVLPAAA